MCARCWATSGREGCCCFQRERANGIGIVDIKTIHLHSRICRRDAFQRRLAASCDDDVVSQIMERLGQAAADARTAASDQDRVSVHLHDAVFSVRGRSGAAGSSELFGEEGANRA